MRLLKRDSSIRGGEKNEAGVLECRSGRLAGLELWL